MSKNIFVEGLENDIVPIVCRILRRRDYNICDRTKYESSFREDKLPIVDEIADSRPDLAIICNAEGYSPLLERLRCCSKTRNIPILVLTGGGPDFKEEAGRYTPHVLSVPLISTDPSVPQELRVEYGLRDFYDKIERIIG